MLFYIKLILVSILGAAIVRAGMTDFQRDYRRAANNLWAALFAVAMLALLAAEPT